MNSKKFVLITLSLFSLFFYLVISTSSSSCTCGNTTFSNKSCTMSCCSGMKNKTGLNSDKAGMACCTGIASGCGSGSCGSNSGCGGTCAGGSDKNTVKDVKTGSRLFARVDTKSQDCGAGSCGSNCGSMSSCGVNSSCGGGCSSGSISPALVKEGAGGGGLSQSSKIIADKGCGGRSLAYIASQQGIKKGESEIVKMIHYDPEKGASMLDIVNAAKQLGLKASGYKMSYDQLAKLELPVIVYLPDHFTVLVSIDQSKNTLTFTDSSKQKVTQSKEKFLKTWQGYVLEIRKETAVTLAK